jgi:uncharacterized membrane protein
MAPLFILVVTFLVLRTIGLLGVKILSSWREAGLFAVTIMFLFTGVAHFTDMKYDYAAMLPGFAPMKVSIIHLTGALQILGAIGLLIPRTRRLAGVCLALLLVAMFPGNVRCDQRGPVPWRASHPLVAASTYTTLLHRDDLVDLDREASQRGWAAADWAAGWRARAARPSRRIVVTLASSKGRRFVQSRLPASSGPDTRRNG